MIPSGFLSNIDKYDGFNSSMFLSMNTWYKYYFEYYCKFVGI